MLSREAAEKYSPRRKPRVLKRDTTKPRKGRKKSYDPGSARAELGM